MCSTIDKWRYEMKTSRDARGDDGLWLHASINKTNAGLMLLQELEPI